MRVTVRLSGSRTECETTAAALLGRHLPGLGWVTAATPFRTDRRPGPRPHPVDPAALAALGPLVGFAELARLAGIEASTLRAYLTRREAGVPAPDLAVGGRRYWRPGTAAAWLATRTGPPALGRVGLAIGPTPTTSPAPLEAT